MGKTIKSEDQTSNMARELGRRGGLKTAKKLGKKHFKKLAQQRWASKG